MATYQDTVDAARRQVRAGRLSWNRPLLMVFARLFLFAAWQGLFALILGSWEKSVAWWPLSVGCAGLTNLALLAWLLRAEGSSYPALIRLDRSNLKKDLLGLLGFLVIIGPVAFLPNFGLATLLYGDINKVMAIFLQPLPRWAALLSLAAFTIPHALTELPTYFGYVMPRLEALSGKRWLALGLPVLMLGLQHLAAPLVFDIRFILWRSLMFLPFALGVGLFLRWKPGLLPLMIVIHALMDLQLPVMILLLP